MSIIKIKRDFPDISNQPNLIFQEDIIKYGWEKAFLLANLSYFFGIFGNKIKEEELWHLFPVFSREKFYQLLNQLFEEKLIQREGV